MHLLVPKVLIELRRSRIEGVGVSAVTDIHEAQRIAPGINESDYHSMISWNEFPKLDINVQLKVQAFCIGTPDGFIPPDDLDFNRLSIEWYFNHSCDGNLGFNEDGDFVARKSIRKGEELTYDYGLAESNPDFRMDCKCGSANCRRVITGNDWCNPAFRAANLSYMLPRLRVAAESAPLATPKQRTAGASSPASHSARRG
jgi:hypothetical protein